MFMALLWLLFILKKQTQILPPSKNIKGKSKVLQVLVTYLLYSSNYNKSKQIFKVEAIVLYCLKAYFNQFFDPQSFKVKNSTEASIFSWLLKHHKGRNWVIDQNK